LAYQVAEGPVDRLDVAVVELGLLAAARLVRDAGGQERQHAEGRPGDVADGPGHAAAGGARVHDGLGVLQVGAGGAGELWQRPGPRGGLVFGKPLEALADGGLGGGTAAELVGQALARRATAAGETAGDRPDAGQVAARELARGHAATQRVHQRGALSSARA